MAWKYKGGVQAIPLTNTRGLQRERRKAADSFTRNQEALRRLRTEDLTRRQNNVKRFTSAGETSYDSEFNKIIEAKWMQDAQNYSDITLGMQNGSVDIAEGTAAQAKLDNDVDVWQKFVAISKDLYPKIEEASQVAPGRTGAAITINGVNDVEAGVMLKNLWTNPKGMSLQDVNGQQVLRQDLGNGNYSEINLQEFVNLVENGGDIIETIEDPTDMMNTAFTGAEQIGTEEGFMSEKEVRTFDDNGQPIVTKIQEYDLAGLRNAYKRTQPFQPIMDDPNDAPGFWEYISNQRIETVDDQGKPETIEWNGDPNWIGSGPGSVDANGRLTPEALKQRNFFERAYTQLSINKNVPLKAQTISTELGTFNALEKSKIKVDEARQKANIEKRKQLGIAKGKAEIENEGKDDPIGTKTANELIDIVTNLNADPSNVKSQDAFIGKKLNGKVIATVNYSNGIIELRDYTAKDELKDGENLSEQSESLIGSYNPKNKIESDEMIKKLFKGQGLGVNEKTTKVIESIPEMSEDKEQKAREKKLQEQKVTNTVNLGKKLTTERINLLKPIESSVKKKILADFIKTPEYQKFNDIKKGKKDSNPAVREARAEYETAFINHIEDELKKINAKPGETITLSSGIKIRKSK
jgi:hypothetical protein